MASGVFSCHRVYAYTSRRVNLFASPTPVAATGYAVPKRTLPCEPIIVRKMPVEVCVSSSFCGQ